MGEFKISRTAFSSASDQLRMRLALLEWILMTFKPGTKSVSKTGKVYLPLKETEDSHIRNRPNPETLIMTVGV